MQKVEGPSLVERQNTIQSLKTEVQFERIILRSKEELPLDQDGNPINLRGSIAFTRDTNHKSWFHKWIWLIQKIHTLIFGSRHIDTNLSHGFIILNHDNKRKGNLLIAHSVFDGIHTASRNYLNDNDVTELVIYRPKEKSLREYLARYSNQTAYTDPRYLNQNLSKEESIDRSKKKKPKFTIVDMYKSFFHNQKKVPSHGTKKRLAYAVTDILRGDEINDRKGKPKSFFCTPYAMTVLQASTIIHALEENEKETILHDDKGNPRNRDGIAKDILERMENQDHFLSQLFSSNSFMSINARFAMTCYASKALHSSL